MTLRGDKPLVSIIITNYNRAGTLKTAVESALEQTYDNIEIIISDDASTDNSMEVISKYAEDTRVKIFKNEKNLGFIKNFKISIEERASGMYFSLLNNDDRYINPKFIEDSISIISKYENVVLLKSSFYFLLNDGVRKLKDYSDLDEFYKGEDFLKVYNFKHDLNWISFLMLREPLVEYNYLDINLVCSDLFINLYMLQHGNICFYNTPSYEFNIHDSNESKNRYNIPEIHKIFSEIENLFSKLKNNESFTEDELNNLKKNYYNYFFKDILKYTFRHNRGIYTEVKNMLRDYSESIVSKLNIDLSLILFKIIFYFPNIGERMEYLKWYLSSKSR